MFEMEELVLNVLKFSLCAPTIKTFLRRYLKAANADTTIAMLANVFIVLIVNCIVFVRAYSSRIQFNKVSSFNNCNGRR